MDAPQPPPPSGTPPGGGPSKGDGSGGQRNAQGARQELVDLFGSDMYIGVLTLVLLLLGLMSASMTRCVCV